MREGAYDTVRHSSTAQVISPLSCGPAAPPTVRSYLDDQEDVCRGVCDGEDGGAGEGGDGRVGNVGPQQALHLIGVQVKVEILRDLRGEERGGGSEEVVRREAREQSGLRGGTTCTAL